MVPRLRCPSLRSVPAGHAAATPTGPAFQRATYASAQAGGYEQSKIRQKMFRRLGAVEKAMAQHPRGPLYVGSEPLKPFPMNPLFQSQPVLDEAAREAIWERATSGEALKVISADMGITLARVAAVVRLKQIEKRWVAEGKKLARPYARAVLDMLPKTSYSRSGGGHVEHEPINDVPVHSYTTQQIFYPTSESRHFTRHDAAKAFHRNMTAAEERSDHKELIIKVAADARGENPSTTRQEFSEKARAAESAQLAAQEEKRKRDEARTLRVHTDRFEYRFRTFNGESVGRDGRKPGAVGWRYGAPLDDRKRGKVKIPTQCP